MQLLIPRWFECLLRLNINFLHSMVLVVSFAAIYLTVCSLVIKNILQMTGNKFSSDKITPVLSLSFVLSLGFTHSSTLPAQNYWMSLTSPARAEEPVRFAEYEKEH